MFPPNPSWMRTQIWSLANATLQPCAIPPNMADARPRLGHECMAGRCPDIDSASSDRTSSRERRLSRLIAKYESLKEPDRLRQSVGYVELPASLTAPTSAHAAGESNPFASGAQSESTWSFPAMKDTVVDFGLSLPRHAALGQTAVVSSPAKDGASGVERTSMVAERRRFFEASQPGSVPSNLTSVHRPPKDTKAGLPATCTRQTLRTVSPSPSARSNSTVLYDTPAAASVYRLAERDTAASMHSSLPDSLSVSSTTGLIDDACSSSRGAAPGLASRLPDQPMDQGAAGKALRWPSGARRERPETPTRCSGKAAVGTLKPTPRECNTAIVKTPAGDTARKLHHGVLAATPTLRAVRAHSPTIASLQKRFHASIQSTSAPSPGKIRQDPAMVPRQLVGTRGSYRSTPDSDGGLWAASEPRAQVRVHEKRTHPPHDIETTAQQPKLRDRIDLFESFGLGAELGSSTERLLVPASTTHDTKGLKRPSSSDNRVGAALRKLSGTWRRARLGSHAGRMPPASQKDRIEQQSPSLSSDGSVVTFRGASQTNLLDAVAFDFADDLCNPTPWLPSAPASNDRIEPAHRGLSDMDGSLHSTNSYAQPRPGSGKRLAEGRTHAGGKRAETWTQVAQQSGRRVSSRRWMSRSSGTGTMVARVQCALQQPRPVRANEVKRLVSLCKDKVTG
ncbi:hypothetical protein JDV02_001855 [Purpureocillium takamizusanense]|uniref:Uncharacterized protein n=1 Tax=Purpureocillium takamizusanense TaxID=2060973 RepID=A0A9Q8Q9R7_9HYPO|nr:uncharacterized protein JDV02_001855 [Purpureocillium takamizusanense]UNI15312.1 hypothetical protein JDV02_001855 [Purpureocillium takamizusanense]